MPDTCTYTLPDACCGGRAAATHCVLGVATPPRMLVTWSIVPGSQDTAEDVPNAQQHRAEFCAADAALVCQRRSSLMTEQAQTAGRRHKKEPTL